MDRQTGGAILIGLGLALGIAVAAGVSGAPLVASATDFAATDDTDTMTETELHWGTVTHETDPETGETHVDVTVEEAADVSVSTATEPAAADEHFDRGEFDDVETETFPWGAVTYATDSETGAAHVNVIVDAEEDVSLSVTSVSDDGTQSTSTSVVQTGGADGEDGEDGEVGTSVNVSQSTNTSLGGGAVSIDIDDGDDD